MGIHWWDWVLGLDPPLYSRAKLSQYVSSLNFSNSPGNVIAKSLCTSRKLESQRLGILKHFKHSTLETFRKHLDTERSA